MKPPMNHLSERIEADLASRDAERIASALRELKTRNIKGNTIPIALFDIGLLHVFGEFVPSEMQLLFVELVMFYPDFAPEPSMEQRIAVVVALVLRYAEPYVTFEVALDIRISKPAPLAAQIAMSQLAIQGLQLPKSIQGAQGLVSQLLNAEQDVRAATLEAIMHWPKEYQFLEVIEYIRPQLEPGEEALLTRNGMILE